MHEVSEGCETVNMTDHLMWCAYPAFFTSSKECTNPVGSRLLFLCSPWAMGLNVVSTNHKSAHCRAVDCKMSAAAYSKSLHLDLICPEPSPIWVCERDQSSPILSISRWLVRAQLSPSFIFATASLCLWNSHCISWKFSFQKNHFFQNLSLLPAAQIDDWDLSKGWISWNRLF